MWDRKARKIEGASRPGCRSIETHPARTTTGATKDHPKNPTTHPTFYVPLPGFWLPGSRRRWRPVLQTVAICCNPLQAPAGNGVTPSAETKRNCDTCRLVNSSFQSTSSPPEWSSVGEAEAGSGGDQPAKE